MAVQSFKIVFRNSSKFAILENCWKSCDTKLKFDDQKKNYSPWHHYVLQSKDPFLIGDINKDKRFIKLGKIISRIHCNLDATYVSQHTIKM